MKIDDNIETTIYSSPFPPQAESGVGNYYSLAACFFLPLTKKQQRGPGSKEEKGRQDEGKKWVEASGTQERRWDEGQGR